MSRSPTRKLAAAILAAAAGCGPWQATPGPVATASLACEGVFVRAMELVRDRYLAPERIDPPRMLLGALEELAEEIPSLTIQPDAEGPVLGLGARTVRLGPAGATDMATLGSALHEAVAWVDAGRDADTPPLPALQAAALRGAVRKLDRWSTCVSGAARRRLLDRYRGNMAGIGCRVGRRHGRVEVVEVFPRTPAAEGGIRVGDVVVEVDGSPTEGWTVGQVVQRLHGPLETPVRLDLMRSGVGRIELTIVRRRIVLPTVSSALLGEGIGYLRISHFSQNSGLLSERALSGLRGANGYRGVLLDLRGNTGGSMLAGARVADQFIEEGVLLELLGRNGSRVAGLKSRIVAVPEAHDRQGAVVVLVDRRTGSSAEVLAATLARHDRALVVGEPTFGKTVVQKLFALGDDLTLKLTVARARAAGHVVPESGVKPDVEVAVGGDGLARVRCASGRLAPDSPRADGSGARGDGVRDLARTLLARHGDPSRSGMRRAVTGGTCGR